MKSRAGTVKLAVAGLALLLVTLRATHPIPLLHLFASTPNPIVPASPRTPQPPTTSRSHTINTPNTTNRSSTPTKPVQLPCTPNRDAPVTLHPPRDSDLPALLRDYTAWHARARACLQDPVCQKRTPVRVLLAYCAPGPFCLGVGDRLRGVYYTFLLAVATKRLFLLEWPEEPFDITAAALPASLDWRVPPDARLPPPPDWPTLHWGWCTPSANLPCHTRGRFRDDRLPLPDHAETGRTLDLRRDDLKTVFAPHALIAVITRRNRADTAFLLTNPFTRARFTALPTSIAPGAAWGDSDGDGVVVAAEHFVLRLLLRPAPEVATRVAELRLPTRFFAVHARVGAATGESGNARFKPYEKAGTATLAWRLLKCVRVTRKRVLHREKDGPVARTVGTGDGVFVASDSEALRARLGAQAGKNGLRLLAAAAAPKTQGAAGASADADAMHVGQAWRSRLQPREMRCDRFLHVFVDVFALARAADVVALAPSHFSGAAAALGRARLTLVEQPHVAGECHADRQMDFVAEVGATSSGHVQNVDGRT